MEHKNNYMTTDQKVTGLNPVRVTRKSATYANGSMWFFL
jgi:hypothetical protein